MSPLITEASKVCLGPKAINVKQHPPCRHLMDYGDDRAEMNARWLPKHLEELATRTWQIFG